MDRVLNGYTSEMIDSFNRAKLDLRKEIDVFYGRYAKENKVSLLEAKKALSFEELKNFKGNLKEYETLAKNSIGTYALQVANLSKKARITRLQALEMQCDTILQRLYQTEKVKMEEISSQLYVEQYYRKQFDIEQYTGFQFAFSAPSTRVIEKVLQMPVLGADISTRLWRQDMDAGFKIRQTLNEMFITGKPPEAFSKNLSKAIGRRDKDGNLTGKKYEAYRLLYNESAFVTQQADLQAYEDDGIEEYVLIETLGSNTCSICRELDGKRFSVKDAVPGVNFPLFHVNCRGTTGPSIGEIRTTRASRDLDTGKTVPTTAKNYEEWYAQKQKGK